MYSRKIIRREAMTHKFGEIKFEELPAHYVICSRIVSPEPENDSTTAVQNWLAQHGMSLEGRRSFGFDVPVRSAEAAAGLRGYEVGFTVPEGTKADDGVQARIYGGGTCAVMRIHNAFEAPFESIPAGWQHLVQQVEQNKEWKMTCGLCYEEVVKGEEGNDLILYLQVIKH
jgi:DNA gyrase inhibitor GyrI